MWKKFIYVVSFFLMFCCCKKNQNNITNSNLPFIQYRNILYGKDTVQQTMDVSLPFVRYTTKAPVIILIHGGAWLQGNKADFYAFGLDTFFTAYGFAVVNMNYRLDGVYSYPAPVDDIALVMEYINRNAAIWNIDTDRVCLLGRSVGAHLALMYAYSRDKGKQIKAVMDFFGPVDLADSSVVYGQLGSSTAKLLGPFNTKAQLWHDASPLFYLDGAVPTAIFNGTADSLVHFTQAQMLFDSLQVHHIPAMLVSWDGNGHGWPQDRWLECRVTALQWINRFLMK